MNNINEVNMFKIQVLNNVSKTGLSLLPEKNYHIAAEQNDPHAILLRSQDLHQHAFSPSLLAIARAGAGVNNIPVEKLTQLGIPVFNTPGANANAVKELVLTGMLLASRNICPAWQYVKQLKETGDALETVVEKAKKQFVGYELAGRTLGVIGLGAIGVKVANAALALRMKVIGFDPGITVQNSWQLSSEVQQAHDINELIAQCDFISIHVPLNEHTKKLINADRLKRMKDGAVLLNFSREAIVDHAALLSALNQAKKLTYVSDFPHEDFMAHDKVIALPHLGASTEEAEENCAVMAVEQLRKFLEKGVIENSVNFPSVSLSDSGECCITIVNQNIPNMVSQISAELAKQQLNITDLINKSRNDIAYTMVHVDQQVSEATLQAIRAIDGVVRVRRLNYTLSSK